MTSPKRSAGCGPRTLIALMLGSLGTATAARADDSTGAPTPVGKLETVTVTPPMSMAPTTRGSVHTRPCGCR